MHLNGADGMSSTWGELRTGDLLTPGRSAQQPNRTWPLVAATLAGGSHIVAPAPDLPTGARGLCRIAVAVVLVLAGVATTAVAGGLAHSGIPPAAVSDPAPAPESEPSPQLVLDQLAKCADSGTLALEIDLRAGRVPAADAWAVEVVGRPTATIVATAVNGRVSRFTMAVSGGRLLLDGKHLRPKILITRLHFDEKLGITEASYRGCGIWRPIVWLLRCLARSALDNLELRTDLLSVLHGEILTAKGAAASRTTTPSPPRGPSFLDLVDEVRILDSELVAFGGRPLRFGSMVELHTASEPTGGTPVHIAIVTGLFRPARDDRPAQVEVVGRVDGEIEDGAVAFVGGRCTFTHGELRQGTFRVATRGDGTLEATLSAATLAVDLTTGELQIPGGPSVEVEAPSRFIVRDLLLRPDGQYSGIVDAELLGKTGRIERGGVVVSLSEVKLRTSGATIVNGRATGDLEIESDYSMDYPLIVHYPVEQVGERRVQLLFQGSLTTTLHLQDAGSNREGTVTGEYRFIAPWPPVEQAAFEVLRAAWMQDITPAMRNVDFVIEPQRFGPCGGSCFLLGVGVTVQKTESGGRLFRQICDAQGKADLVVDKASRSFILRNVRIEPRCEGAVGWIVDFVGSLLATTYSDITLFQMPTDLPFTIESVDSDVDWLAVEGRVDWTSSAFEAPRTSPRRFTSATRQAAPAATR